MTRRGLSDSEWELVEPFLPSGRCGPYPQRLREQFEGVIRRFRTGSQWRASGGRCPWSSGPGRRSTAASSTGLQLRGSIIWMSSLNPGPRYRRPTGKPDADTAHVRPTR
ncbi:transposase [Streptomyces inhibens]|uniref:Transposase n=1 Tax=Streptomyces inhibens TaxID=2293571 RepID=A0A371Q6Y6_STRIH|nr:transposase [Streptomyces inhibens]